MKICLQCSKGLSGYQKKFCSLSCAAKYTGPRRPKKVYPTKFCKFCEKEIRILSQGDRSKTFCNHSCSASFNNRLTAKVKTCPNCNEQFKGSSKYCSTTCSKAYTKLMAVTKWLTGEDDGVRGQNGTSMVVRKWLFEKHDSKCAECGWNEVNTITGRTPLECHHIDGNHKNNKPENLILLCPNCHSLTSNHKALNRGRGRESRRKNSLH